VRELHRVKVGCCGFPCSRKEYFSQFKLVEVQQTFYKMPKLETALSWRQQAPPDFEFSLKAWQLITHPPSNPTYRKAGIQIPSGKQEHYGFFRPSDEVHKAWEETRQWAQALRARVIVFQCPASFEENRQNIDNLISFLQVVGRTEFLFAWEPRGKWSDRVIQDLCRQLGLIHCVDLSVRMPLYGQPWYLRLHGPPRYRHRYSEEELIQLKSLIQDRESYVLFNNINMYHDALAFDRLLTGD
jgi:uncharacterized protein YecE (DUF72 family)